MLETRRNMVWLASYPKSGNTWFRVFLSNLLSDLPAAVHINDLSLSSISSNRSILDDFLGIHTSELSAEEIDNLRPQVYKALSEETEGMAYVKTHEARMLNGRGIPLFPEEITRGVVYIIRNPLDVAISYAYHNNESLDETIALLNNQDAKLCGRKDRVGTQTRQVLGSWSKHVNSWTEDAQVPVHVLRYEDMLDRPHNTFKGAVDFLELDYVESDIRDALINSSFNVLKEMEARDGFKERGMDSKAFFRKGKSNQWKHKLSGAQVNEIVSHHGKVMNRFGYMKHLEDFDEKGTGN